MSIYIKGMDMPTSCYDCPLAMQSYATLFGNNCKQTKNSYACVLTHKAITSTKRNRFCPLVPVPPHGRLIDADALEADGPDVCSSFMCDGYVESCEWGYSHEQIKNAPTIIPADEVTK